MLLKDKNDNLTIKNYRSMLQVSTLLHQMHQYNWYHFLMYKAIMLCKGYGTKTHRRIKWKQGLVSFTCINKSSRSPCDLNHLQFDLKINGDHLHPEINICAIFGDPCSILCQVIFRTRFGLPRSSSRLPCDPDLTKIHLKISSVHLNPK